MSKLIFFLIPTRYIENLGLAGMFLLLTSFGCAKKNNSSVPTSPKDKDSRIEWDQKTLKKVSSSSSGEKYCGYARIVQLSDASLLAVYEADGSIVSVRSSDLGNSWSLPELITPRSSGMNMTVPEILMLKDKSLLVSYNARPYEISPSKKFGIRIKRSLDGGNTWYDEQLLYEAGYQFENGCWEPAAIQLPGGEIQLYFANEGPYSQSDEQNISMLRSTDNGLSWTKIPEIISFRPGKRDGMPVPLVLQNGQGIAVAIEDNGKGNFKPYIIKSTIKSDWPIPVGADSENRIYALSSPIGEQLYAGAPYLRQLKTGETVLSYQGTEERTNKMEFADMKVVIGDTQARNFSQKSAPFKIPANRSCLWNSLSVLEDDTIVALTSTNAYSNSNNTEVWMIKGKLIRATEN